jgi:MFS family permease
MVSTGLIAIDATILATAVPSIVRDVGGFAQFPWLFSVYLLAQAVSVSVYAKLADTVGRKPIMLLGIGLFLVGSVLCGVAWSMPALILFRAVQGLGAGAVFPMRSPSRATSTPWPSGRRRRATSRACGPLVGRRADAGRGVLRAGLWRWIFFVNVPLCLLAGALIAAQLPRDRGAPRAPHRLPRRRPAHQRA